MKASILALLLSVGTTYACPADWGCDPSKPKMYRNEELHQDSSVKFCRGLIESKQYEKAYMYYLDYFSWAKCNPNKANIADVYETHMGKAICAYHLRKIDECKFDIKCAMEFDPLMDISDEDSKKVEALYRSDLFVEMIGVYSIVVGNEELHHNRQ